jgi:DNA-directed RNA polymerase subunit RPC12/RpoP
MSKRNPMQWECPECGSRKVKSSRPQGIGERIADWFGITPVRCLACEARWQESLWRIHEIIYARCPRCFGLKLTTWEETYYHVPWSWKVQASLGAKKVRCKACRHNFLSFRKVKAFRKWENLDPLEDEIQETTISLSEIETKQKG